MRYVEANALRAGLVKRADAWPWGSLRVRMRGSPQRRAMLTSSPRCPAPRLAGRREPPARPGRTGDPAPQRPPLRPPRRPPLDGRRGQNPRPASHPAPARPTQKPKSVGLEVENAT
jgi:hypothetical protein